MNIETGQIWLSKDGAWKAVITSVETESKVIKFKLVENSQKVDGTTFINVLRFEDADENQLSLRDFLKTYTR